MHVVAACSGHDVTLTDANPHALEFARDQEALSLELRAVSSLARLLAGRGEKAEARSLLASVYERFDEGRDTADLVAAKDLLTELA